jgi:flagellar hook-length control protein FliK
VSSVASEPSIFPPVRTRPGSHAPAAQEPHGSSAEPSRFAKLLDSQPSDDPAPRVRSKRSDAKPNRRDDTGPASESQRTGGLPTTNAKDISQQEPQEPAQASSGQPSQSAAHQGSNEATQKTDQDTPETDQPTGETRSGGQTSAAVAAVIAAVFDGAVVVDAAADAPSTPDNATTSPLADGVTSAAAPLATATPAVVEITVLLPNAPQPEGPLASPTVGPVEALPEAAQPSALPSQATDLPQSAGVPSQSAGAPPQPADTPAQPAAIAAQATALPSQAVTAPTDSASSTKTDTAQPAETTPPASTAIPAVARQRSNAQPQARAAGAALGDNAVPAEAKLESKSEIKSEAAPEAKPAAKPEPKSVVQSAQAIQHDEATIRPEGPAERLPAAAKPQTAPDPAVRSSDTAGAVKAGAELAQNLGLIAPAVHVNVVPAQSTAAAAAAASAAPTPAPAAMPVPVAGLAVEIAAQAQSGKHRFEIRLDPPELGRVDVRLEIDGEGHVKSRLVVERTETLDLLRRDAPQLERALQQAGLKTSDNALEFSLRHQAPHHDRNETMQNATRLIASDDSAASLDAAQQHYGRLLGLGGGIDIRV